MKALLTFALFWTLPTHAFYLSNFAPSGGDVDMGSEIRIEFDQALVPLGNSSQAVKKDQIAKISITPAVKCKWSYRNVNTLVCEPQERLSPMTKYEVTVQNGFRGEGAEHILPQEYKRQFKTSDLAIMNYKVWWTSDEVLGDVVLNYAIKPEGLSGVVQCETKSIPATLKVEMDHKIQVVRFRALVKDMGKEACSFYFNKPLSLERYPVKGIPREKVVLEKDLPSVTSNGEGQEVRARCNHSYEASVNLNSPFIPQLDCEWSGMVTVEVQPEKNWKKLIKVRPSHAIDFVETEYQQIGIKGFRPNTTYLVSIPKKASQGLTNDLILQMNSVESPPLLGVNKNLGVIERGGPWLAAFSAMNIKSVAVDYKIITSTAGLGELDSLNQVQDEKFTTDSTKTIQLNGKDNENNLLPLDLKALGKEKNFEGGLIMGHVSIKDVEPRYQEASEKLVMGEWERNNRSKFFFAYLVTDIGLHLKVGEHGALVWATSLKTGKPLKDVSVTLLSNGVQKQELSTDKKGMAYFEDFGAKDKKITVVAKLGDDVSYIDTTSFWERGISLYEYNLKNWSDQISGNLLADVVAERPLFLPGESVEMKFFVRQSVKDSLELKPAGEMMQVVLYNSRDEEILKTNVALNQYGTAVVQYKLDPGAPTGDYPVMISVNGQNQRFGRAFKVQEFRKPEIKVAMSESNDSYDGKVTYYSGGEKKNAEGELAVIFQGSTFSPTDPNLRDFSFPKEVGGLEYGLWDYSEGTTQSPEVLARSQINTDEKGEFGVIKDDILKGVNRYGVLTVEAVFKDSAGGDVAGRVSVPVNPYKHIPGVKLEGWYYKSGDKLNPQVVAIDPKGKPGKNVKMELEVYRINWIYERRLGSGNYFYTDSRREDKKVFSCAFVTTESMSSCDVTLKEGGEYLFKARVAGEKNLSPASTSTWVMSGGDFFGYKVENHDRINIGVENNRLKFGDKVRLMALAPFTDGEALVTFERNGVIFRDQVSFKGNVLIYEKVLNDERFIPGFYASIVMVKGRSSDKIEGELDLGKPQFKMGYARVEVEHSPKKLSVSVKPRSPQVKPGEEIEISVSVADHEGNGTKSELAVAVVDDSLLSLSGDYSSNYDVLDTFYALAKPKVDNYQTLTQIIGRRTFGKKGASPGGGGGAGLRSDFKNTAYWVAQVETDGKGHHSFKFKVPDNLTTWKVIVVSVDDNHRFGFGEAEFLATKPLTVEPIFPNFLIEGDKFLSQVSVANRSGEALEIAVKASARELTVKKAEEKVTLSNNSRTSLTFPMEVPRTETASVEIIAAGGKHSDGFRSVIPVERNGLSEVSFSSGIASGNPLTLPMGLPANHLPDSVNLSVEYSTTAMNGLDEVFGYVLGYPYGCWEQRLSKAYFLVQYEHFKDIISYRFKENKGSIQRAVQDLLDLARDYQTASGGMRYYPGGMDSPDVYLSIFTAYSFNVMKRAGYKVDQGVEAKLKNYLRSLITGDAPWVEFYDGGTRNSNKALILSVLAEMGEKDLNGPGSRLYAARNSLDLFALSFLGNYLSGTKGFEAEAKNVFDRLDSFKSESGNRISFREPVKISDKWKWWSYTDTRSQCAVLSNLVSYSNDKKLTSALVREVLARMTAGHWYNTQESVYCFEGLRRFVQKFESHNKDAELVVKINDDKVSKAPEKRQHLRKITLAGQELPPALKKLELSATDEAELYFSTTLRYETPYVERAATNAGFGLSKRFFKKTADKYVELTEKVLKLQRGDTLKIALTVKAPGERYQVLLNDRLAATFEPINMDLATASKAAGADVDDVTKDKSGGYVNEDGEYWSPWFKGRGFEFMDLRLNAVQFYSRKLPAGTYDLEYLVQVRTAGEFSLPESVVEEMYYPEVRGTFSGRRVIVEE